MPSITTSDVPRTTSYLTSFMTEDVKIRYLLVAYFVFVFFSSLFGDSIVLAASIQPNGIRLNKFIVTIMQHIAVSDLISCFSFVLPNAASLIANRWVLDGHLMDIQRYVDEVIFGANTILIALLSTSKLLMLRYPAHTPRWTIKRAHIMCALIWVFGNISPATFRVLVMTVGFEVIMQGTPWINYIAYFLNGITLFLPVIIMIITTGLILCYLGKARRVAARSGGRMRLRGVATVVITATIYVISVTPISWISIYLIIDKTADLSLLWGFATPFTALNIMSNIYVYYLTIPSLREFIRVKILRRPPLRHQSLVSKSSTRI